jgi:hypothetical protein
MRIARYALFCGGAAGLASIASLMLLARSEGRSPWQPVNATSHWIHGDAAASVRQADLPHTAAGLVTNQLSATFWGVLFGIWLANRPPRTAAAMLRDAAAVSAIAGAIDYGLVPRRLRPGWELALSNRSVALAFGAMALGLAAGGLAAEGGDRVDRH